MDTSIYTSGTSITDAWICSSSGDGGGGGGGDKPSAPGSKAPDSTKSDSSKSNAVTIASSKTLYIGNLYEEELTGASNPPYITYYHFGGKLVGMRRANQQDPTTNGQLRVVGDHLGSTSLVVDTSNPPQVIHR
jgi:hypothetical protein